jgi:hypothetical protein
MIGILLSNPRLSGILILVASGFIGAAAGIPIAVIIFRRQLEELATRKAGEALKSATDESDRWENLYRDEHAKYTTTKARHNEAVDHMNRALKALGIK